MFCILLLNKLNKYLKLFIFIFLFSCSSENNEGYIASYKDDFLTLDDALIDFPPNVKDTSIFLETYINDWLITKVILNKAKLYIDEDDSDIINSVNQYKETLIIYKYQNELINSQFDTTVTMDDVKKYYEKFSNDFVLHKDIVKARLIKINKETLHLNKVKDLVSTMDEDELLELVDFCEMYAENSFLNDSVWVYLSEFSQKLPNGSKENKKLLSNKNKIHSFMDDNFIYIIFVRDYQIKGNKSPLSFVFSNIRKILQNKNKKQFITNLEKKLYQEALYSEHIKIY
ncbi:MAG: hypothetical protein CMD02_00305 [Flavobacteriales bacterium]|nr:hypothetical protein [Flavobacteriales bacterium]|tara:strand:- start:3695 stop:4552 length:858 start_codon:yes stop_codon:yes gene_type:complete